MPGISLTQVIGGPCLMTYRGATFRSKGDVSMNMELATFPIETSLLGQVDERVREHPLKLTFTPDGEWTNLGVLWPYANTPFGSYITPQFPFGTIAANQINVGSTASLLSGDAFVAQLLGSGTFTNGLVAGTLYYLHVISSTNISVHTTYANAVAGVNPIAISAGSGNVVGAVNNPLTIQTLDGYLWTFFNAAVGKMPNLSLSTVRTAVGGIEINCYLADGQDWSGASSLYSYAANPWPGDSTFNPQSILTGEIAAVWGSVAPWSSFVTKDGWEVNFNMSLEAVEIDNVGLITHRLSNLVVTAEAIPLGVQPSDVATALYLQGTNAARGRSLSQFSPGNLLLSAVANNLGCKLFGAAMRGGPSVYSINKERIGRLTWVATRTFGSTGPNALFAIGGTSVS